MLKNNDEVRVVNIIDGRVENLNNYLNNEGCIVHEVENAPSNNKKAYIVAFENNDMLMFYEEELQKI